MPPTFDESKPVESFKALVLGMMRGYRFDVEGLYLKGGTVRPLPSEAAVVGKVLEVSIHEYLSRRLLQQKQLKWIPASSDRIYPDVSFNGPMIFPNKFALDVKCARRSANGKKTESAITIGTFDAEYFRYPEEKVGNIMMPYGSYTAHLSLIALYTYEAATARDVELLVVEKWRVATKKRSSGTRCYIAASPIIADLRAEKGAFESEEEFNAFWRAQAISESKLARWRSRREGKASP
jgi:hypothetical protein